MTDGGMGECPPWYRLLSAARYLQVAPWELAEKPAAWVRQAEAAQDAEAYARETHRQKAGGPVGS